MPLDGLIFTLGCGAGYTRAMRKTRRLSVDLDARVYETLSDEAERRGVPIAYLIRALIQQHIGGPRIENKQMFILRLLREGASTDRIEQEVMEEFGEANRSSINWYRSKLRRDGEKIPLDAEAREAELRAAMEMGVYDRKSD